MNAVDATAAYEDWLGSVIPLVEPHLDEKHRTMAEEPFAFMRATFYLWAVRWPERCADVAGAAEVGGVGDLHIENFGTWRDSEGRLVWGVNDFDEATVLPYTSDLVRLATSAILARDHDDVSVGAGRACKAIMAGYREGFRSETHPFVLAEAHTRMRGMATGVLRNPVDFWARFDESPEACDVPAHVRDILVAALPGPEPAYRLLSRVAGVGSLGRTRVTAVADWQGARVAREAKVMVPSAWDWAGRPGSDAGDLPRGRYRELLLSPRRCPDPCVSVHDDWVVRRLAPDCSRVELADLPSRRDEVHLLECMGRELANVHLGTPEAAERVGLDLDRRPDGWLRDVSGRMADSVRADWKKWRRTWKRVDKTKTRKGPGGVLVR